MSKLTGLIIAGFGRLFLVENEDGKVYQATTRSKRVDYVCGDRVIYQQINDEQVVIEEHLPRTSLLYRQDNYRTKMFAANVTQVAIVVAGTPSPSESLLQRALVAAEAAKIKAIIVLNKMDLPETAQWQEKFMFYQSLGYPLIPISASTGDISSLQDTLQGECSILLGQSGMGKSTLTNAVLGEEITRIGDLSEALGSGKHTTTHTQLYHLNAQSELIDSPGLQEFGLKQIEAADLIYYFPDLRPFIGKCRFHNCTHRHEPGCALKEAAENNLIKEERLRFFQTLIDELTRSK